MMQEGWLLTLEGSMYGFEISSEFRGMFLTPESAMQYAESDGNILLVWEHSKDMQEQDGDKEYYVAKDNTLGGDEEIYHWLVRPAVCNIVS